MVFPTRVAIKYSPPTIALEYSEDALPSPSAAAREDLVIVEVPLPSANGSSDVDALLHAVQAAQPKLFSETVVSIPQVKRLLGKLVEHLGQAGGAPSPSPAVSKPVTPQSAPKPSPSDLSGSFGRPSVTPPAAAPAPSVEPPLELSSLGSSKALARPGSGGLSSLSSIPPLKTGSSLGPLPGLGGLPSLSKPLTPAPAPAPTPAPAPAPAARPESPPNEIESEEEGVELDNDEDVYSDDNVDEDAYF